MPQLRQNNIAALRRYKFSMMEAQGFRWCNPQPKSIISASSFVADYNKTDGNDCWVCMCAILYMSPKGKLQDSDDENENDNDARTEWAAFRCKKKKFTKTKD